MKARRQLTVIAPGLETTVQELPGRIGHLEQGFPISGPFDAWSFRQANLLVGNSRDTAALECQFLGPTLRFDCDASIAITGGGFQPRIDGQPVPMWQSLAVAPGQVLELGAAMSGARAYVAISGGLDTPVVLGSRAVFHMARVGGQALVAGETLPLGSSEHSFMPLVIPEELRPPMNTGGSWTIETMLGPNDDWLTPETIDMFFSVEWRVQAKSNRTGIRLTGPQFDFSERATRKNKDHGFDPSNILDHGYPMGAVNLAGQTPIVLVNDSPSTGGFINPFTIVSAAIWKLGQARPGEMLKFRCIDRDEARQLRLGLESATSHKVAVSV